MDTDKTQALIQSLGFSGYESKAYLALLRCQPASAYELSKQAGIPSSKIYEVVHKLLAKSIFQPIHEDSNETQQYVALQPTDFIKQITEQRNQQTEALLPLLENFDDQSQCDYVWPITELDLVTSKAYEMITHTQSSILISTWADELSWLKQTLEDAASRGVKIALVHFGKTQTKIGATYYHPIEKTLYQEKGARGLTLVVDGKQVLIANFDKAHTHRGTVLIDSVWSKNQTFVTVAEDYVKHDVYITKVTRFLPSEMRDRFGEEFEQLRDIYNADA